MSCCHEQGSHSSREEHLDGSGYYPDTKQLQPSNAVNLTNHAYDVAGEGAIGARNRAILVFLLDTGCRAGGLCNLRLEYLDMEGRRAFVTEKGNKTRAITFTQLTVDHLRERLTYHHDSAYVFYDLDSRKPLTPNGLLQLTRRLGKRAGVNGPCNPHSFHHAHARGYLQEGGDLATLAKHLGHRDVSTTVNHYAIFTDTEIREKHEQYSPVKRLRRKG